MKPNLHIRFLASKPSKRPLVLAKIAIQLSRSFDTNDGMSSEGNKERMMVKK